ncbi:6906_t:CDS:2 [Paraglomus occultum]|uniref:6906_t:CDS:1 n=1 Tax=Paraglomus occultum TaxID=144539 RepID=A0A9N9F465_9GLOM|nr:6906_t:CDS:2 [Paraglomus occultum]
MASTHYHQVSQSHHTHNHNHVPNNHFSNNHYNNRHPSSHTNREVFANQWRFNKSDLNRTPSRSDGISKEEEMARRCKGVKFIVECAYELKLPQPTIATATTYLHRFYMRQSLAKHHHYDIGGTCLFLACKSEESNRKLADVATACAKKAQKNDRFENRAEFEKWAGTIRSKEPIVLAQLCFDFNVEHPYVLLLRYARELKVQSRETARLLAVQAWCLVNDSLRTPLCLIHTPQTIASAALYLSAKLSNIDLNDDPNHGKVWWSILNNDIQKVADAAEMILEQYKIQPEIAKEIQIMQQKRKENGFIDTPCMISQGDGGRREQISERNGANQRERRASDGYLKDGRSRASDMRDGYMTDGHPRNVYVRENFTVRDGYLSTGNAVTVNGYNQKFDGWKDSQKNGYQGIASKDDAGQREDVRKDTSMKNYYYRDGYDKNNIRDGNYQDAIHRGIDHRYSRNGNYKNAVNRSIDYKYIRDINCKNTNFRPLPFQPPINRTLSSTQSETPEDGEITQLEDHERRLFGKKRRRDVEDKDLCGDTDYMMRKRVKSVEGY